MARIRTVKPDLFRHEDLFEAEADTGLPLRLAFIGLFTVADREGRFKWRPRQIKLDVLPYDDIDFSRVLDALVTRGFVVKYASDGEEYGCIPSFTTHQVINNREKDSDIPEYDSTELQIPVNTGPSQRVPNACPTRHDLAQAEGKGREGNKEEEKERNGQHVRDNADDEVDVEIVSDFDQFWKAYPKKTGKVAAEKAFKKAKKNLPPTADLIAIIEAQKQQQQWKKDGGQYIPNPATWLNQGRWEDEPAEVRQQIFSDKVEAGLEGVQAWLASKGVTDA
jgi:hypothetical protein